MSHKKIAIAFMLVLAVIALIVYGSPPVRAEDSPLVGKPAPDFTLKDINDKDVKLSTADKGKVTLLTFWVTWCPHCQREMPVLQDIYSDLSKKGLQIVAVGLDDPSDVKQFAKDNKLTYPVLIGGNDKGSAIANTYGVEGVPTTVFIDKNGVVKNYVSGEQDEETIRGELAQMGVK